MDADGNSQIELCEFRAAVAHLEEEEKLCVEVEKYPCLYDKQTLCIP